MQKILISACLMGIKVRYDGGDCYSNDVLLRKWVKDGRVIMICPEVSGGLAVPRPPAEIIGIKVVTKTGIDVTTEFNKGAQLALDLCKQYNIKFALLKAKSPSCGNQQIYDGTFSRTIIDGQGITAKLLTENGIKVFNETQFGELKKIIDATDS